MSRINLINQTFGRLTVLEYSYTKNKRAYWKCQCSCGKMITTSTNLLRSGKTKSCGCLSRDNTIARNIASKGISKGYKDDLKNQRFDRLIVLEFSHVDKFSKSHWKCQCDCGNTIIVSAGSLKKGHTKSCGCLRKEIASEHGKQYKDITGQRFGKLTAISTDHQDKNGHYSWKCQCDCGNITVVRSADLLYGSTKSCGCLRENPLANASYIYNGYKYKSIKRGYDFNITFEDFLDLTQHNCVYCNTPPSNLASRKDTKIDYIYNGIDRLDNTKGYVLDNCVPCCKHCNIAKNSMTESEFLSWIEQVYNHRIKK